jgi:hypothetical protein
MFCNWDDLRFACKLMTLCDSIFHPTIPLRHLSTWHRCWELTCTWKSLSQLVQEIELGDFSFFSLGPPEWLAGGPLWLENETGHLGITNFRRCWSQIDAEKTNVWGRATSKQTVLSDYFMKPVDYCLAPRRIFYKNNKLWSSVQEHKTSEVVASKWEKQGCR